MGRIWDTLNASSDHRDNWYAWVTNQRAHGVLGIEIAVVFVLLGLPFWAAPLAATLAYWVLIECFAQKLSDWRDSLMDTAHVMAGATMVAAIPRDDWTALIALAVWLALQVFGVWRRL